MKIALVSPTNKLQYKALWPDLGLGYLTTALKRANHDVRVIDLDLEVYLGNMTYEGAIKAVAELDVDVVGFKILNLDIPFVREATAAIKARNPKIITIAGGPGTLLKYFLFNHVPHLDYGFLGEAELSLPLFLERLGEPSEYERIPGLIWRDQDLVCMNEPKRIWDLDSVAPVDWEALAPTRYPLDFTGEQRFPIMVTRGCPFRCRYCQSRVLHGPLVRSRSMDSIIDELRYLKKKFNPPIFHVTDDNLTVVPRISVEFPQRLIESGLDFKWRVINGIRLDTLTKDIIRLFEQSGCYYLYVALESGSQRVLDLMDRQTNLQVMIDSVHKVHDYSNIKMLGYVMLGFPGETVDEAKASCRLLLRLPLERGAFFTFTPLPDTPVFYDLLKDGLLEGYDVESSFQYGHSTNFNCLSRELDAIRFWAFVKFYSRPNSAYRAAKSILSQGSLTRSVMRAYTVFSRK